jgi:hypothetical protein
MPNPTSLDAASDASSIHLLPGYCTPNSSMTLTVSPELSPPSSPPSIPTYCRRSTTPYSSIPTPFYTPSKSTSTSSMSLSYNQIPLKDNLIKLEDMDTPSIFNKIAPPPLNSNDTTIFYASPLSFIKNIGAAFSAPLADASTASLNAVQKLTRCRQAGHCV